MENVQMKLYPEDRHELLNEVDRQEGASVCLILLSSASSTSPAAIRSIIQPTTASSPSLEYEDSFFQYEAV